MSILIGDLLFEPTNSFFVFCHLQLGSLQLSEQSGLLTVTFLSKAIELVKFCSKLNIKRLNFCFFGGCLSLGMLKVGFGGVQFCQGVH